MDSYLSNDDGGSNRRVHDSQVALLRYEATHPRDPENNAHALVAPSGRRYCLGRDALRSFRERMNVITLEALSHNAQSPEWVAKRIAEAAERAIVAIGVERAL
jgi:hypothetical protein